MRLVSRSEPCEDHHAYEDEYGTKHSCPNCRNVFPKRFWTEFKPRPEYDAPPVRDEDTFEI